VGQGERDEEGGREKWRDGERRKHEYQDESLK
jgi:hypothetical protein